MFFHDVTYVLELLQRVCAHCFAGVILRDSRIDLVHLFALIVLSAGRSVAGCLIHASALWLLLSFCITQRRPPGRDGIRLRPSPALMVQLLGLEQMALQTGWLMIKVYDSLLSTQHSSMSGLYSRLSRDMFLKASAHGLINPYLPPPLDSRQYSDKLILICMYDFHVQGSLSTCNYEI